MPNLVVVAPGDIHVRDGVLRTPEKFLSGMRMFAKIFPGDVTLLGPAAHEPDADNLGDTSQHLDELGFACRVVRDLESGLRESKADVALLSLSDAHAPLVGVSRASVVAAEHAARSWLAMSVAEQQRPLDRLRMEVGYRRLENRMRRIVARAEGLHCNGVVAWSSYASHSANPIRVYDSRVSDSVLARAELERVPSSGARLRLGFSGRLTAIKGPQFVIGLTAQLAARGIDATLDVFGDGPMRAELESMAGPAVHFHGSVDYEQEWVPWVSRRIDLMVLPHVQPDPSGTYFEAAGLGVPVLAFRHETSIDLSRHGWVFVSKRRSMESLASAIQDLVSSPALLQTASEAGFAFMREHTFEADFALRVEHLVGVMGQSRTVR